MRVYAWFVRGKKHAAMANTSIAAVRRADPEARCIVVSDDEDKNWKCDAHHLVCTPGPIMVANLDAQVNAMNYAMDSDAEQITFLDTDTIMLRTFMSPGDVSFTWRDNVGLDNDGEKVEGVAERMPYNYGVVTARPTLVSLECFIWMRERVRAMHQNHQMWYGNQLAAVELAGRRPDTTDTQIAARPIPWTLASTGKIAMIGKLPCSIYNYTPQKSGEDVTDKCVLHFKGRKRHLMAEYARKLGLPWELPDEIQDLAVVTAL